jgi:hypothetical protein
MSSLRRSRASLALSLLALSLALGGCVTLPRAAFTEAEQASAAPDGFSDIRYDQDSPALLALLRRKLRPDAKGQMNALAISGGGANGAYGAGLIYRWSEAGDKPTFQLVTGVSTGALTAPFAFLGKDWDSQLRYAYSGPKVPHLLRSRGLLSLLTPGVYSKAPLRELVEGYVTDALIQAVAAEHAKGRQLLVATTNLDTERLMIWDMGAIAAHGGPEARALFAEVLIASASVPGVFPPSMIAVTSGGKHFTEMHVDGQTQNAFFAIPGALLNPQTDAPAPPYKVNLYVVINGHVDSLFAVTRREIMPILARTFDVANKASIRSVLLNTAEYCRSHDCALKVSALPSGVKDDPLDFGVHHIHDLFAAGEAAQTGGAAWSNAAPH